MENVERDDGKIRVRIVPCEVYTRTCGYYRPTHAMHPGKLEEVNLRTDVLPKEDHDRGYGREK